MNIVMNVWFGTDVIYGDTDADHPSKGDWRSNV